MKVHGGQKRGESKDNLNEGRKRRKKKGNQIFSPMGAHPYLFYVGESNPSNNKEQDIKRNFSQVTILTHTISLLQSLCPLKNSQMIFVFFISFLLFLEKER